MPDNDNLPDEEIKQLLKKVVADFDKEDRAVRDRQIRLWRKLKLYWDGFQRVWYSEVAHDWRIYNYDSNLETDYYNDYYDKPVNVFRAYLESIIAALSITIPQIQCFPDDADNALDISTAKAGNDIAELVYRHNNISLVWLHGLYIYCTEGLVCAYNYTDTSEKYGTYKKDEYKDVDEDHYNCPTCEAETEFSPLDMSMEQDTFSGEAEEEVQNEYDPSAENLKCPECGIIFDALEGKSTFTVPRLVGTTDEPKSRQKIEAYGGLYVKVPNYAITQEQMPYLFYSYETHYTYIIEKFRHLSDIEDWDYQTGYQAGGVYDPYERWGRLNPQYQGEYPIDTVTLRQCWLRPVAFNVLKKEDAKKLSDKYPSGVKVTLANDEFCEAYGDCLDDHWTLTKNPLSDYLHHDPLGLLLTSVQDITNELVSLTLQTIEHGIPQTFADPAILNFDQYRQTEVAPGMIFPLKTMTGRNASEGFHEIKTATLSREVLPFGQEIQSLGQLVVGALPSLFGGSMPGSGETAAQYSMSRAQALQRLQTPWKMFTIWWKEIFGKVIPAYIKYVEEDEHFVTKNDSGTFINVFIRKAEIEGKIGSIELDSDENLPVSWAQRKDAVMQLMQLQIPQVMEALTSPENLPFIAEAIGLNEFKLPGEADRQKQYEEINILVNSAPIPEMQPQMDPMTGMPMLDPMTGQPMEQEIEIPSVEIDPDVDNDAVQAEICRSWLISDAGRLAKKENPEGYKNVLLHYKMHQMNEMQKMAPPMGPGAPGEEMPQGNGVAPQSPTEGVPNVPGPTQ